MVQDEVAFRAAAKKYRNGAELPLLDGPLVRRDLRRLNPDGKYWAPERPERHVVGIVPGDRMAEVGQLLALSMDRPTMPVDLRSLPDLADSTLTVVCAPERLTPEVMAGAHGPVSFFTCRTLSAACALLLRTLVDAESGESLLFDADGPFLAGTSRLQGAAATPAALTMAPPDGGLRFAIAGKGHGRECMLQLGLGHLCARAEITGANDASAADRNIASCRNADECVRRDMSRTAGLSQPRASELPAVAVLLDSCRSVSIAGRLSSDLSLALSALDGTAVVVAGCPATRQTRQETPALFVTLLTAGMTAGDVVHTINQAAGSDTFGSLVLLGDAARQWPARGSIAHADLPAGSCDLMVRDAVVLSVRTGPDVAALGLDGPQGPLVAVRSRPDQWLVVQPDARPIDGAVASYGSPISISGGLRDVVFPTLDALERWPDHGLPSPDADLAGLRDAATKLAGQTVGLRGRAAIRAAELRLADLTDRLLAVQGGLADTWLAKISAGNDRYTDNWPQPVLFQASRLERCPDCGLAAEEMAVQAGLRQRTRLRTLVCSRCGEVAAGSDEAPGQLRLAVCGRPRRNHEVVVRVSVADLACAAVVSAGVAVSHQKHIGTSLLGRYDGYHQAGSQVEFTATASFGHQSLSDSQIIRAVAIMNGLPFIRNTTVWVAP